MEHDTPSNKDMHNANRLSWNAATNAHNSHRGDQVAFFKNGGNTLYPEEKALLGDIAGLHVVHLQCNAGQDTLSLAQLGATVTGVDISDEAISFAQKLAQASEIDATFIRADVYDWLADNQSQFEVVFSSYGAIPWLSDLAAWGAGIAQALKPGGRFVLMEFHPLLGTIADTGWSFYYDYMGGGIDKFEDGIGDYVAESGDQLIASGELIPGIQNFENPHPVYEFSWGVAEIVTALVEGGLTLTKLREYPFTNGWKPLPDMREAPGGRNYPPAHLPVLPLMLGIVAQKPPTTQKPQAAHP